MPHNVEIKAVASDFERQKQIAESLSDEPAKQIEQEDIFYHTPHGRLKLRIVSPDYGELIYYEREDACGPKPSHYLVYKIESPAVLNSLLSSALDVRGVVRKKRILYLAGQTRIHLDEVEELGSFIELEVVMQAGQSIDAGRQIAVDLMTRLGIRDEDLIHNAYIDLLTKE
ncbi:MAG: class IV adenylate cyclase [Candidatus Omnitrophica bacterium]|nr:class IV adenylate cyclase [Candidatus Omnitrophota bacterium]